MSVLGKRLKESRENKKITQIEAAKLLGISNGTLSGYEREYRDPDTKILEKMADLYGVKIDYLLGRTNEPQLTEQDYLHSIMKNDSKFKDVVIKTDGKALNLEEMLKFIEENDVLIKGELMNHEERRRFVEVIKAMYNIKKDTF